MLSVEVYADVACPFAYVGLRELIHERDARGGGPAIRVRAWPLEWVNGRPLDGSKIAEEVAALRAGVSPGWFTGFDRGAFPATSLPAFGLVAAAYERDEPTGEAVSLAVRIALFEDGRDIADPAVLREIGEPFRIAPIAAEAAEAAVRADWERGRSRGVRGSPHFFAGPHGWFCPVLDIHTDGREFDVSLAEGRGRFFASVFAG